MNFQRMLLPEVRIQRRCPWKFPITPEQRTEATTGGTRGKYSPFYRCGYSPDVEGGRGQPRRDHAIHLLRLHSPTMRAAWHVQPG
jgi:hypothetical protein